MVMCGSKAMRTNAADTAANAASAATPTAPVRVRATDRAVRTATQLNTRKASANGMPPVHSSHVCPLSM